MILAAAAIIATVAIPANAQLLGGGTGGLGGGITGGLGGAVDGSGNAFGRSVDTSTGVVSSGSTDARVAKNVNIRSGRVDGDLGATGNAHGGASSATKSSLDSVGGTGGVNTAVSKRRAYWCAGSWDGSDPQDEEVDSGYCKRHHATCACYDQAPGGRYGLRC